MGKLEMLYQPATINFKRKWFLSLSSESEKRAVLLSSFFGDSSYSSVLMDVSKRKVAIVEIHSRSPYSETIRQKG